MPHNNAATGSVTANAQTVSLDTTGQSSAVIEITGSSWVGTIQFEYSPDNGANWYALPATPVGATALAAVTSATANGVWRADVAAFPSIRVRSSAWTSGTATVQIEASEAEARPGGIISATIATNPLTSETLANVANSLTNVTLAVANANRRSFKVFNDGSIGNLYVKHGATASLTSFTVKVAPGQFYEMPQPVYTGQIDGIWDAAGSIARVTEGA